MKNAKCQVAVRMCESAHFSGSYVDLSTNQFQPPLSNSSRASASYQTNDATGFNLWEVLIIIIIISDKNRASTT